MDELNDIEDYPNVNYFYVSVFSILTIVVNKIFSCWYVWNFTHNTCDIILNVFDFYIFKEIYASHLIGNKTDLMQFLQKIERIFES